MTASVPAPRRRLATGFRLAAAALLCGAPLWWSAPAAAGPAGTVTFAGGCGVLGLGGSSSPDQSQLAVPSGAELAFRNQLGRTATLRLNGEAVARVDAGEDATVEFHTGPVAATMEISCLVGQPTGAVTVEVTSTPRSSPLPPPSPPAQPAPSDPGDDDPGDDPGEPGDDEPGDEAPSPRRPAPFAGPGGSGSGDQGGRPAAPPPAGTWSPAAPPAPAGGGSDGGEPAEPTDRATSRPPTSVDGGANPSDRVTVDGSATVVDDGSGFASEPLSETIESAPESGPIGLLALIATVCVVGVSAGVVRAIIAQRARRAEWA